MTWASFAAGIRYAKTFDAPGDRGESYILTLCLWLNKFHVDRVGGYGFLSRGRQGCCWCFTSAASTPWWG
jgi:hypothetical protein